MKPMWKSILAISALVLAACASNSDPKASSVFIPDNVYGPRPPAAAQEISPEEFEQKIQKGELVLMSAKKDQQRRKAEADQLAKDRAFLQALPDKSEALKSLLGSKSGVEATPEGDYVLEVRDNQGKPFKVRTLGDAAMLRSMVESYEQARKPDNAWSVYQMGYASLEPGQKDKLPDPGLLQGKPLADIQKALAEMDKLLQSIPGLDAVAPAQQVGLSLSRQSITITEDGPRAGNGMDNNGPCGAPSGNGLYQLVNWPLKFFISPVKNQASRGTCWAFSAVGAVESREQVVNNRAVDLSEQYLNNVHKRDAFLGIDAGGEGAYASHVLDKFMDRDLPIANERAWTYNPGGGRRGNSHDGICDGYTGLCSESNHQSPTLCARVRSDIFCGFETVNYSGSSTIRASRSRVVWENSLLSSEVPVALMRSLMANGQTLFGGFGVFRGFDNPDNGYVTDFSDAGSRGGHEVLIVGFVPDGVVASVPAVPGGTGGGFFIIRNSWGCMVGDAGFYYIPVRYLQRFFGYVRVLEMPSTRSTAWNNTLEALRPPSLSLSLVGSGPSVDLNQSFRVQATLSGGGTGCCPINWLPAPISSDSRSASFRFSSEGEQTIRATVRTSRGIQVIRDLVVNVVNTPPRMGIVGPLPSFVEPLLRPGTVSSFRASARDPNEPGGILRNDQIAWTITRPDGSSENRSGYAFNYAWDQIGTYRFRMTGTDTQGASSSAERSYTISNDADPFTGIDLAILSPHPYQHLKAEVPIELLISSPIPPDPKKAGPLVYRWTISYTLNGQQKLVEIGKSEKLSWTPLQVADFVNLSAPLEVLLSVEVSDPQYGTQGSDSLMMVLEGNAP